MRFYDSEQEGILIASYQNGTSQNIQPLIDAYRSLLYSLAKRLCCPYTMIEELVQSGYIGLLRAAKGFNPEYRIRFITYAVPWILGEMKKTMRVLLSGNDEIAMDSQGNCNHLSLIDVLSGNGEIDIDRIDLRIALQCLSKEERILITLRYYRDKSQSETARILKKSQAQISRMERRVLDTLKKDLS